MRILAVDDEKIALQAMMAAIEKAEPSAEIVGFRKVNEALDYVKANVVDVAFLDIEMGEVSGVVLARQFKIVNPTINIVFATGYSEYQGDAFEMHASGYIMKPITRDKVKQELENLRYPKNVASKHRVRFHCFGNFEAYIDENPIKFKYDKSKELLAYLVEKGGTFCSKGEIMSILWEDDSHESYLRNIRSDLKNIFDEAGCGDVLLVERGKIAVNKDCVDCDLYSLLEGKPEALNSYRGEYMEQYSWGEFAKGVI